MAISERMTNKNVYIILLLCATVFIILTFGQKKLNLSSAVNILLDHWKPRREQCYDSLQSSKDLDWSQILHFVPLRKQKEERCKGLFTTNSSKHMSFNKEYDSKYSILQAKLQKLLKNGLTMSGVAGRNLLTKTSMELAKNEFVKNVCEIGFNAGHSALAWLTAKPGIKLFAFDIGKRTVARPMANFIEEMFPKQFNITFGDSIETVPEWIKKGIKCDIVSVDGGHGYKPAYSDLYNMRLAVRRRNILVADDTYRAPGVRKAWKELNQHGIIEEKLYCEQGIAKYTLKDDTY